MRKGDIEDLKNVLNLLGAPHDDVQQLEEAIIADRNDTSAGQIGARTWLWLSNMLVKAGNGGLKVGLDVAASALSEGIKSYLGL